MAAESLGSLVVDLSAENAELKKVIAESISELDDFGSSAAAIGAQATAAFAIGAVGIASVIGVASDLNEQMNVIETSFGDLTPAVLDWAEQTADAVGRSEFQMREFAGTTQSMLAPMLGSKEAAADMSLEIAQLAVDLGSFKNVADEDALASLKAGLIGSAEPMQKFGVVMTEAELATFALAEGITKSTKAMTGAEKVSLRFAFIMSKTKDAQGDAARTAEGFANQQKRVAGLIQDIAGQLGDALLPVATDVITALSGMLGWIKDLSPETKKWASFIALGVTALSGLVAGVAALAIALPSLSAGFALMGSAGLSAVLPILPIILAIGAGIAGVVLLIGLMEGEWKGSFKIMIDWVGSLIDGLKETAALIQFAISNPIRLLTEGFVTKPEDQGDGTTGVASRVVDELGSSLALGLEAITDALSDTTKGLMEKLVPGLDKSKKGFKEHSKALDIATKATTLSAKEMFLQADMAEGLDFEDLGDNLETALDLASEATKDFVVALTDAEKNIGKAVPKLVQPDLSGVELAIDATVTTSNQFSTSMAAAGETIVGAMGEAGGVINAAIKGFQSGGIVGGIIAAIAAILLGVKSIQKLMDGVNAGLGKFQEAIDGLFTSLLKQQEMTQNAMEPMFEGLGEIFDLLGAVALAMTGPMELVSVVLELVAVALSSLMEELRPVTEAFEEIAAAFSELAEQMRMFFGSDRTTLTQEQKDNIERVETEIRETGSALGLLAAGLEESRAASEEVLAAIEAANAVSIEVAMAKSQAAADEADATMQQRMAAKAIALAKADAAEAELIEAERVASESMKRGDRQLAAAAATKAAIARADADTRTRAASSAVEIAQLAAAAAAKSAIAGDEALIALAAQSDALGNATETIEQFDREVNKATEALTNIPKGIKLARIRFDAIDTATSGGADPFQPGAQVGTVNTFIVEQMIVESPEDAFDRLQEEARRRNFQSTGTPINSAPEFGGG